MERRQNDERIAVLETKVEAIDEIKEKLDLLIENMNKTKGFWAGAIAAGTALGGMIGALLSWIFHYKTGS